MWIAIIAFLVGASLFRLGVALTLVSVFSTALVVLSGVTGLLIFCIFYLVWKRSR